MALPLLIRDSLLMVSGPLESAAYVAMTEDALQLSKLTIPKMGAMWAIPGQQRCHLPKRTVVEGDWSNTAFFLCMGALSKEGVTVEGLNLHSSQGDRGVLDVLRRFGAEVTEHGDAVTVSLRNYLYTMTKNYLLNYIRHNGRVLEQSYVIAQLRQQQDDTLAQYIESRDIDRRLGEAIDRLPRQQRAVIMMKRDGCSNREIAEKLHVSINTVKTHYADGLRSLRLSIGPIIKMITLLVMIRSL